MGGELSDYDFHENPFVISGILTKRSGLKRWRVATTATRLFFTEANKLRHRINADCLH